MSYTHALNAVVARSVALYARSHDHNKIACWLRCHLGERGRLYRICGSLRCRSGRFSVRVGDVLGTFTFRPTASCRSCTCWPMRASAEISVVGNEGLIGIGCSWAVKHPEWADRASAGHA